MVGPAPELRDRLASEIQRVEEGLEGVGGRRLLVREPRAMGLNDGLIVPGEYFPLGTPPSRVRSEALERAPLRGRINVIVVLVDFSDQQFSQNAAHFNDLFFSVGTMATGSVRDFFREASHGLIDIQGQVVGPYRLPRTIAAYANGDSGTGSALPNARTMARDAAQAADADVNFAPYDNDGNGFVDAFVVVHAGPGAEQTGNPNHIWSHKWVLSGGELVTDTTKIFAYLTVPEDARIGVCAHELGHLVFGWPDLYDTDNTSEGIGNWCLMAGGSWNGGGDTPAHPSAWCKVNQGWVTVINQTSNSLVSIQDVKDGHTVYRLWKDGGASAEHFLVENRQKARFDAQLPASGLLIWHIDDSTATNTDEAHYKVALEQADGKKDLEGNRNRGDGGDPYPGSASNRSFDAGSNPNSKSYAGVDTCVAVTEVSDPGPTMTARLRVRCGLVLDTKARKDVRDGPGPKVFVKDAKDARDEPKSLAKEIRDGGTKRLKDLRDGGGGIDKRVKDVKDQRDTGGPKTLAIDKRPEKPVTDKTAGLDKGFDKPFERPGGGFDLPGGGGAPEGPGGPESRLAELEARLGALEERLGMTSPFIGGALRPDLTEGAFLEEGDVEGGQGDRLEDPAAKRLLDTPPPLG
jgi:immune inhibitor A